MPTNKNTKLILTFGSNDSDVSFSFPYADPDVTTQNVKDLVSAISTHAALWDSTLSAAKSAIIRVTTDTNIDISQ